MKVRFYSFAKYHNKKQVGSTDIRVNNLIRHWPQAEVYKHGEYTDVIIFQKVYCTADFDFPEYFDKIKILDICDPDWLEGAEIKRTVDNMDAIVTATEPLKEFVQQMTDKPVVVIPDRFDLNIFPEPKRHKDKTPKVVWFGYSHNASTLKSAMHAIIELGLDLTVISNKDPNTQHWAECISLDLDKYHFKEYKQETIYKDLQDYDIAILPKGNRPLDIYKSNNRDIIAQLCGIPIAKTREELENLLDHNARNKAIDSIYSTISREYDVRESVRQYKELIDGIRNSGGS